MGKKEGVNRETAVFDWDFSALGSGFVCSDPDHRGNLLVGSSYVSILLCDTVIGLQVAAGGYLPIGEGSLLHKIIFMDFFLSWFFYLPSQILIALSATRRGGS